MDITNLIALGALVAGLALGVVVTRGLHANPRKRFWNAPLGPTRYRRANFPLGGTLAGLVALALWASGHPDGALIAAGAGLGMAAGAIGVGLADPLR
ncbi:hypothetical protein WMF28_05345 [Sorangium sp. So ce590]|uniref:hypothetical protein n=1 Tax=Sorangium sp. So ce590 TaxID=3133317 RepID=UPI003F606ED8